MKKLLSILGSLTLVASSASLVSSCADDSIQTVSAETQDTIDVRQQSLNALKGYVLADQYGLDLAKTQKTIIGQNDYTRNTTFENPNTSVIKGLNLNGSIGRSGQPIYSVVNIINAVLGKLNKSPINIDDVMSKYGDIIAAAPQLINTGRISDLLTLVPSVLTILNNTGVIPSDIDFSIGPKTMALAKQIISMIDVDSVIKDLVKDGAKSVSELQQIGTDALDDLLNNILFRKVKADKKDNFNDGDSKISVLLGKEVLTPLLNGKEINSGNITKYFNGLDDGTWPIDILSDVMTFVATLAVKFTVYVPMLADKPSDANHLFGDQDNATVFKANDTLSISYDKDTDSLKAGDNNFFVSLDALVMGSLSMITNEDPDSLGILKLTNILFHDDQYDMSGNQSGNGILLDKITYWLIDALKFTDYEVKVQKKIENIPVLKTIDLNIDFKLKQLFEPGTLVSIETSITTVKVIINNNGLRDISSSIITPLLYLILSGKDMTKYNDFQAVLKPLWNDKKQSVFVDGGFLVKAALNGGLAWNPIWEKIGPLFKDLLTNAWYKNLDSNLSPLGIDTTEIDKITPLSKTISDKLENFNLHDISSDLPDQQINLLQISQYISLDVLKQFLHAAILDNPIQDEGQTGKSLLEQVLNSLNDSDRIAKWTKYLGYVSDDDAIANGGLATSGYVYEDSIIGELYKYAYPEYVTSDVKDLTITVNNKKAISQEKITRVKSQRAILINQGLKQLSKDLQGRDINYVVQPLWNNSKVWTTSNVVNEYFTDSNNIEYESYNLSFDSSSVQVYDTDATGKKVLLPVHKGTYKIWFSRTDARTKFKFSKVEKIN